MLWTNFYVNFKNLETTSLFLLEKKLDVHNLSDIF